MTLSINTIKRRRSAVVEEVEELRQRVEAENGTELDYVKQPLNVARANVLDAGEYNYCVRSALVQLQHVVEESEADLTATRECIQQLTEQLADKAVLPSQDQLTR